MEESESTLSIQDNIFYKKIDKGKPASISIWWIYTAMGYKEFLASTPQMGASKHKKENYKTKKEN